MSNTSSTPETVTVRFEDGMTMSATVTLNARGFYTLRIKVFGSWINAGEISLDTLDSVVASGKPVIL